MSFCTVVNCMDGRVQLPVISYLQDHFGVKYVDSVTEPGSNGILANGSDNDTIESILSRVRVSVEHHKSVGIAVVGHYDCAGNPVDDDTQIEQIHSSVAFLEKHFPDVPKAALWVDSDWNVNKLS